MLFWPFVFASGFLPGFLLGVAFGQWLEILYSPPPITPQSKLTRAETEANEILSRETETNGL